jgi:hypothetical protein
MHLAYIYIISILKNCRRYDPFTFYNISNKNQVTAKSDAKDSNVIPLIYIMERVEIGVLTVRDDVLNVGNDEVVSLDRI